MHTLQAQSAQKLHGGYRRFRWKPYGTVLELTLAAIQTSPRHSARSSGTAEFQSNYLTETLHYDLSVRLCTLEINAGGADQVNRIARFLSLVENDEIACTFFPNHR